MKKINMFWYKMPNGKKNFGDDLGPFIVENLSGLKIKYIPIVNSGIKIIALFMLGVIKKNFKLKDSYNVFCSLNEGNVLLSIGSILSSHNKKSSLIWGAGLMNLNAKINNAHFYAVRGKYSQQRLEELGYTVPKVLGDPALLLPLILKPTKKRYRLGIIPHYIHYDEVKKVIASKEVLVINLLDEIEEVVNQITSCENTISSSLHGLIISHSYDIPSLWANLSKKKLAGDNIKFKDYFSSVEIQEYAPFKIDLQQFNLIDVIQLIKINFKINGIQNDLHCIQMQLINAAPFPILNHFKL